MANQQSILNIFKIGIGPSSSHTIGPILIGNHFIELLQKQNILQQIIRLKVDLYGSLSLTGKGHLTDVAIILGLMGYKIDTINSAEIPNIIAICKKQEILNINQQHKITFKENDIVFNPNFLDLHENGIILSAYSKKSLLVQETYFSIGGGSIATKAELLSKENNSKDLKIKYDFKNAEELLTLCEKYKLKISDIALKREISFFSKEEIENYYLKIWQTMQNTVKAGLSKTGKLSTVLPIVRRAKSLHDTLIANERKKIYNDTASMDWITAFALATSEENASGNKVVTSPTNGACGIIPAVLHYYQKFFKQLTNTEIVQFFLTASAIGYIFRTNASISGAEAGCQAEVGVASSMAAAALTEIMGGNYKKVANAAEIAMEHHLGLTCDPVAGLVMVPCIERNAFGAVKAVMAAKMALSNDGHIVSLDDIVNIMYETGKDIKVDYRETSKGGLAKHLRKMLTRYNT